MENDLENGYGKFTYLDGNIYEGNLNNGILDGIGKIIYKSDGSVIECNWQNNYKHGHGIMKVNGEIHLQKWQHDKLVNTIEYDLKSDININNLDKLLTLEFEGEKEMEKNDMQDIACPISLDYMDEPIITNCGHVFCKNNIKFLLASTGSCPMCRNKIESFTKHQKIFDILNDKIYNINDEIVSYREYRKYKNFLYS